MQESFYPVLRLLLPNLDRRRHPYNLKEGRLAQAYISALDLAPNAPDSERLTHWRNHDINRETAGDFAGILQIVVRSLSRVGMD